MIAVNELSDLKCNCRAILEPLVVVLSPLAPHIAEELWSMLGHNESISFASYPQYEHKYTVESTFEYPVSFNGKLRFKLSLPKDMSKDEVESALRSDGRTEKYLQGAQIKKIIVVPSKIINVVC
jgi:leucyl-tRNA synthetase